MTTDLKLGYSGGSGGYLLFHLLLLSGKYYANFDAETINSKLLKDGNSYLANQLNLAQQNESSNIDINTVIKHQWDISDPRFWKTNEIHPKNKKTKLDKINLSKIYLFGNPDSDYPDKTSDWYNYSAKSVIIYTDLPSQVTLAYYKNCKWFINNSKMWYKIYNQLKGSDWPNCSSYTDLKNLTQHIQNELYEKFNFLAGPSDIKTISQSFTLYKHTPIIDSMIDLLETADHAVKLQDLVNTNGEILLDISGLDQITDSQRKLLFNWRNLHDKKILDKIGIVPNKT
jgi:hypothetical protein